MTSNRPVIVIVGAGFGGLATVSALKNEAVDIVLVDQRNYHLFQPLLYQVATAWLSPADIGVWGAEERQKQLSVCSNRYQRDHAGDAIRLWQRLPAPRTNTAPAC